MTQSLFSHVSSMTENGAYMVSPVLLKHIDPLWALILGMLPIDSPCQLDAIEAEFGDFPSLPTVLMNMYHAGLIEYRDDGVWISPEIDQVLMGLIPDLPMRAWKSFESAQGKEYANSAPYDYLKGFCLTDQQIAELGFTLPKQARPKEQKRKPGFIYLIEALGTGRFKIGVTDNITRRLQTLQRQSPYPLHCVSFYAAQDIYKEESEWHRAFAKSRVNGEWFELDANSVAAFCAMYDGVAS